MGTRDVRSEQDLVESPTIREDTSWADHVNQDDLTPYTTGAKAAIPMDTGGGVGLVGPDGQPMSMRGVITKTHDEIDILWERKKMFEPCWMCIHFRKDKISPEEKRLFFTLLAKEHGCREDWIENEFGNPEAYEYCEVYETFTHKNASCPRPGIFKKRDF